MSVSSNLRRIFWRDVCSCKLLLLSTQNHLRISHACHSIVIRLFKKFSTKHAICKLISVMVNPLAVRKGQGNDNHDYIFSSSKLLFVDCWLWSSAITRCNFNYHLRYKMIIIIFTQFIAIIMPPALLESEAEIIWRTLLDKLTTWQAKNFVRNSKLSSLNKSKFGILIETEVLGKGVVVHPTSSKRPCMDSVQQI